MFLNIGFGQPRSLRFDNYTSAKGLSENNVFAIYKDSQGFMWFGTDEGLNRFDGNSFTIYKPNTYGERQLPGNRVRCISEASGQKLLIGFEHEGICILDLHTDVIKRYVLPQNIGNSIQSYSVYDIEKMSDTTFWIATDYGIQLFDSNRGFYEQYNMGLPDQGGLSSNHIRSIHFASSGFVWIAHQNGLLDKIDPIKHKTYCYKISNVPNQSIGEDSYGNIWIGTAGNGLVRISPRGVLSNFKPDTTSVGTLSDSIVPYHCIVSDNLGRLWVGTSKNGLNELSQQNGDESTYFFIKHRTAPSDKLSMVDNAISSLFFDNDGILWVGHRGSGVSKVSLYPKRFSNFALPSKNNFNKNAQAICPMQSGQIWVGTQTNGIVIFDNNANKSASFYSDNGKQPLKDRDITSITVDSTGNKWIGTNGGGLIYISQNNQDPIYLKEIKVEFGGFKSNQIVSLLIDNTQDLWVATPTKLYLKSKMTQVFQEMKIPEFLDDKILKLSIDKQGDIWICTNNSGAFYFNAHDFIEKNNITHISPASKNKIGISHHTVYDISQSINGKIWIATGGGGITIWDKTRGSAEVIGEREGLPTGIIRSIIADKNGKIWMSTHRGIVSVSDGRIQLFNQEDGLMSENFIAGSSAIDKEGRVYFGADNGLVSFRPDQIMLNYDVPRVILKELRIFNTPIPLLSDANKRRDLLGPLHSKEEIVLSYRDYVFSLEFSAIELNTPGKCIYQYRLMGFDDKWITTDSKNRIATYTNLRDGEYTFMVKAANGDGVWSKTPTSIRIKITPPFWETAWFRTILLAIITGSIMYFFNRYKSRIENQKTELNQQVTIRTIELESQKIELENIAKDLRVANATKDRFFSIIAHDLKSPFNAFIGFTGMLRDNFTEYSDEKKIQILDIVSQSAVSMDDLLTNLLNWARTQNKAVEYRPQSLDLHSAVNTVLHIMMGTAESKKISLFNNIENGETIYADPNQTSAILRNLISNSIKFTNLHGTVTISAERNVDMILITVSDTGVGMTDEQINSLFIIDKCQSTSGTNKERGTGLGLVVVKEFVELNGGEISINSKTNKGTTVTIALPINKKAFDTNSRDL